MAENKLIEARLNVVLHDNQKIIHRNPARFKTIKSGKRFGKTYWALYELLQKAGEKQGIYWYTAPFRNQAKTIAWNILLWMLPYQLIRRKLENELFVELINGSKIYLIGEDHEESLRGPALHGVVRDECA